MTVNPKFKLGKRPSRRDYRLPRLSKYASLLAAPPRDVNYFSEIPDWGMLCNDEIGDCGAAAVLHAVYQERVYAEPTPAAVPPTPAEALALYSAVGGYVPGKPETDQGLFMLGSGSLMDYWAAHGICCGGSLNKPAAFVQITQPSPVEWQQAIALYGSLLVGLQLPEAIVAGETPPKLWSHYRGAVAGGHEVLLVGYEKRGRDVVFDLVSWGAVYQATQVFLQHCVDEAIAVANTAFINATGVSPGGLTLEMLVSDMPAFA